MDHLMTKPTKWHVRPAKTQISLGIRPVRSESSLSAWKKLGSLATHWAHNEVWSDWADAQADRSFCWAQRSFCFVTRRLKIRIDAIRNFAVIKWDVIKRIYVFQDDGRLIYDSFVCWKAVEAWEEFFFLQLCDLEMKILTTGQMGGFCHLKENAPAK